MERVRTTLVYVLLTLVTAVALFPIGYMLLIAGGEGERFAEGGQTLFPETAGEMPGNSTSNLGTVMTDGTLDFRRYLRNTLLVAILAVSGTVVSSAMVAYAFARVRWSGSKPLFMLMLATMMVPFPVIMVPLFTMFRELGLIGTFGPLWVPAWFGNAFSIFLMRQFFMTIPRELDDAARIDGCGHFGIFRHIMLPLATPALLVVALLHFMFVWNDFVGPLIFLSHRDQFTLALGLQLFMSRLGTTPWHLLMSATTLMVGPVLVLFLLTQRSFVEGISTSGTKG